MTVPKRQNNSITHMYISENHTHNKLMNYNYNFIFVI